VQQNVARYGTGGRAVPVSFEQGGAEGTSDGSPEVAAEEQPEAVPPAPQSQGQSELVLRQEQNQLTNLHRQALKHYQPGMSYRELGELINIGKDKAGDLIKDLKKWGFLKEDEADK
jgi:predicted HTH transcriptional regulator